MVKELLTEEYANPTEFGLGRNLAEDDRDANFLMGDFFDEHDIPEQPDKTIKYWWPSGGWFNQFQEPECVEYMWHHYCVDGPVTQQKDLRGKLWQFGTFYDLCQQNDEWAGPPPQYAGTSVRAGAKVAQMWGFIDGYFWAWNIDTIVRALRGWGPVCAGTLWTRDMFYPQGPDARIAPTGSTAGGHAYLLNGINLDKEIIRIKNSWGRKEWKGSNNGHATIAIADFESLLKKRGEACIASEVKKAVA